MTIIPDRDHERLPPRYRYLGGQLYQNRPLFTAALKHYYNKGFTYIELGDGDELWENRRFSDVYNTHREIYGLLQRFHADGRLFMLFGNHDRIKENAAYVWKKSDSPIPFYESIVLDGLDLPPVCMFHGYQGDLINDQLWKVSRWLVRYLWKPLEIRGIKDPTSAAKKIIPRFGASKKILSVTAVRNTASSLPAIPTNRR